MRRSMVLISAPSNLGLRPLRDGHEPGSWGAPFALRRAGLDDVLRPIRTIGMARPIYDPGPQRGTAVRNGHAIRAFGLTLADHVRAAAARGEFPFVVGGDCSILPGALAGARALGGLSLVHLDGHSDFRHPGNADPAASPYAAAGMDLALATGRGETLLTEWPGLQPPLVPDEWVVQVGEREDRNADYAWPDVEDTAITRIGVFAALEARPDAVRDATFATLDRAGRPFWIHLDVDVLDEGDMPAVDSPGSPGLRPEDLIAILRPLLRDPRAAGLTLTDFDPDLDPDGRYARLVVGLVAAALG